LTDSVCRCGGVDAVLALLLSERHHSRLVWRGQVGHHASAGWCGYAIGSASFRSISRNESEHSYVLTVETSPLHSLTGGGILNECNRLFSTVTAVQTTISAMILAMLRGTLRVTAAITGLLLVYGTVYAMEAMTTRIPMSVARELVISFLFMLPWMLLFCSGLDDLATIAQRDWLFWVGAVSGLFFLYYFERNTTSSVVTKAAMPLLAVAGGALPHVIRRIRFLFTLCSFAAGCAGLLVLYFAGKTFITGTAFATTVIAVVITAFGITATATGVLALASLLRKFLPLSVDN
jgi:hypothetical protein